LKKNITLGIGIEKKIYDSGPGGIGNENSSRFRTLHYSIVIIHKLYRF
jgi:hypothetical protein